MPIIQNSNTSLIEDKSSQKTKTPLFAFAYCGSQERFQEHLKDLAELAEPEPWCYETRKDEPYHILKFYIFETFSRCQKENKILYSNDGSKCTFNTGLLTKNNQDILCIFKKNSNFVNGWSLYKFVPKESIEYMSNFDKVAELPKYWSNYDELYFNPDLEIRLNIDHILDDNWERISTAFNNVLSKAIVSQLLLGALEEAKIKIKRNMRLVVPQYYRDKIMFLIPIVFNLDDSKKVTLAIAVEKMNDYQYRANTIFTLDMAYSKARQLMRPESNWLISNK